MIKIETKGTLFTPFTVNVFDRYNHREIRMESFLASNTGRYALIHFSATVTKCFIVILHFQGNIRSTLNTKPAQYGVVRVGYSLMVEVCLPCKIAYTSAATLLLKES